MAIVIKRCVKRLIIFLDKLFTKEKLDDNTEANLVSRVYLVPELMNCMLDENMKGTRGHCLKLRKIRCTRDSTRHFF